MGFGITSLILMLPVIIGGVFVHYLRQTNKDQLIKLALAFSGGFLLAIAFLHFLPDLYTDHQVGIGAFILVGFLIQLILEYFSGGIEHGHVHVHKGQSLPWGLFISLSIHSIIEGIPLGNQISGMHVIELGHAHGFHSHAVDDTLLFGILFHQFPVAIALMTLFMNSSLTKGLSWTLLMLFGLMTPVGILLGLYVPIDKMGLNYHMILAVVMGMFLHISTTIIFETSENHKFNFLKLLAILVGCGVAFIFM
jgi:zinc transporter ZupT